MTVFEKYLNYINSEDAKNLSELFAEGGRFDDGARRPLGLPDLTTTGRERIFLLWSGIFSAYKVRARLIRQNPASMEYDVDIDGTVFPCVGAATLTKDGHIAEYIIRAR